MKRLSNFVFAISILAVFVSVNIYVWVYISGRYNKSLQQIKNGGLNYVIDINDENNVNYFMNNYTINYGYSTRKINNPLTFFGNDTLKLQKLLCRINSETLVYRFSGYYCDACNQFVIKKIKQYFVDFATSDRILFIGSDIDPRLKVGSYGKNILSLLDSKLGLPIEDENIPFLFLLDKNGKIKMTFIPDKSMPKYTDKYLELIKSKFLEVSQ